MKNKQLQNARRAERAAAKARERKKANKKMPKGPSNKGTGLKSVGLTEKIFPESEFLFWRAHGINYLMSDYTQGTWTPLYPGIYGDGAVIPSKEELSKVFMKAMGEDWAQTNAKYAAAWCISPREVIWTYKTEALRRLSETGVTSSEDLSILATAPHQPVIWKMFHDMNQQWAARLNKE